MPIRLLFITQKVDRRDPVLGFVPSWLSAFSERFAEISVICLEKGEYDVPPTVSVSSLGKEKGRNRLLLLCRFFAIIWKRRGLYDAVFIHMNPIYAVLGGIFWKAVKKPVILWYIHPKADRLLFWARPFVDFVATAAKESFPLKWSNVRAVGHGIDTDFFRPDPGSRREPNSLLTVGRIAPIKRLERIQEALAELKAAGVPFSIDLIGGRDSRELSYYEMIQRMYSPLIQSGEARFLGPRSSDEVREAYNRHQVLINFTPTGSFDKVVLEAMSSEVIPVTGNASFKGVLPPGCFVEGDSSSLLFEALRFILSLPPETKDQYGREARTCVLERHNLKTLPLKIKALYEELLVSDPDKPTHAKV